MGGDLRHRYDEEILSRHGRRSCASCGNTQGVYESPVHHEMLAAWVKVSADPNSVVVKWLRNGPPLGIELLIKTAGVFPPAEEAEEADRGDVRQRVVSDAVLEKEC